MSRYIHSYIETLFCLFFFLSFHVDAVILNILLTCSGWIGMNLLAHVEVSRQFESQLSASTVQILNASSASTH